MPFFFKNAIKIFGFFPNLSGVTVEVFIIKKEKSAISSKDIYYFYKKSGK